MKAVSASTHPLRSAVAASSRCARPSSSSFAANCTRRRSLAMQASPAQQQRQQQQHPGPPPTTGHAPLPNRSLIAVAGVDAPKFLQGLVTASVYQQPPSPPDAPREEGFYTAFLTAQGRVLHDAFVHPNPQHYGLSEAQARGLPPGHSFLVEVSRSQVDALFALMRRYKLRSKLVHRKVEPDEASVYSYWNEAFSAGGNGGVPEDLSRIGPGAYVTRDSRAPDLGWRVITGGEGGGGLPVDADECPRKTYTVRRFLRGVAEGPGEIVPDKTLPLDANIDLMGGVDFRKGCYVGQELTIRTKHRGVVRKRILPCVVYADGEPRPQALEYRPAAAPGALGTESVPSRTDIGPVSTSKKRPTGHWINGIGNIGLAMCRLQPMTDIELPGESADSPSPYDPETEFILKWEAEGGQQLKVKPFVPDWIREKIAQSARSRPAQ